LGGDFLVYPDDPLQFHAHYIVIVLQSSDVNIYVLDIISWGRMGLTVRKSPVIASVDKNGKVVFITIEWLGNGRK